jgi:hypothetical protein
MVLLIEPVGDNVARGWMPCIAGLAYLGTAILRGRSGSLWAPGIIIGGWGIAPSLVNAGVDISGQFYLILGVALLIAATLGERFDFAISRTGMAVSVLFIGGVMFVNQWISDWLSIAVAALLAGWALWDLRPQREPAREPAPARS